MHPYAVEKICENYLIIAFYVRTFVRSYVRTFVFGFRIILKHCVVQTYITKKWQKKRNAKTRMFYCYKYKMKLKMQRLELDSRDES